MEEIDVSSGEWRKMGGTLRIVFNMFICELCKYLPSSWKIPLYRLIGVQIGENTVIAPHVQIDPFFPEKIEIGEDVLIGWGSKILTHEDNGNKFKVGEVVIGDGALIGHSSSTRPDIVIGEDATIGAHSFVNRDVKDEEDVAGVPIERI